MNCEQFLFEASYVTEDRLESLGGDAREHLNLCATCHARFNRLRNERYFINEDSAALFSERLHGAIDAAIAQNAGQRGSWGKFCLHMALSLLILGGSTIAYEYGSPMTSPPQSTRVLKNLSQFHR